jgi:hypothetical protein
VTRGHIDVKKDITTFCLRQRTTGGQPRAGILIRQLDWSTPSTPLTILAMPERGLSREVGSEPSQTCQSALEMADGN